MNKLKEDIVAVIQYSQNLDCSINVDQIYNDWYEAKKHIINNLFNGELIYESEEEYQFELSEAAKEARLSEFISTISNVYGNDELAHFLIRNSTDFYSNILSADYPINFSKKIKKGTKIIKAFKEFETDKPTLRYLQDAASTLIQENKVKGKLCLSVHPLDFLSSSENTYHWHSCHNLQGDYRAGNLSYMYDPVTIICYLKGEEKAKLPSFPESVPWNSKKWRMLIHLHPDCAYMIAGRQYPFSSEYGMSCVLSEFIDLNKELGYRFKWRGFTSWNNDWTDKVMGHNLGDDVIVLRGQVFTKHFLIKEEKDSMAYNDLLRSTIYTKPYISVNYNSSLYVPSYHKCYNLLRLPFGHAVPCVHCGNHLVEYSNSMLCPQCDLEFGTETNDTIGTCSCCGRRIILNDAYDVNGYEYLCQECYEEQCFVCDRCGCVEYNENQHWHKGRQMFLCDCCYDEVMYEEEMTDDEDYYEDEYEDESEEEDNGSEGNCSENESNRED